MHNGPKRVMEEQWDFLIVLDACRYDYFHRVYSDYLEGDLSRARSVGSSTVDWRDNSFPGVYEDVVYVSSNPYINSLSRIRDFMAGEHFARVYDVWAYGWDENKGTVLPGTVNRAAVQAIGENANKRFIIHYLQPHAPYLGVETDARGFPAPNVEGDRVLVGLDADEDVPAYKISLFRALTRICYKFRLLGEKPAWRLREYLHMRPASPMDAVRRAGGDAALRAAYEDNLRLVLEGVAELLPYLSGRIIVTADHGEWLGEDGCYSHRRDADTPYLREIPWLVIDKRSAEKKPEAAGARPGPGQVYSDDDQKKIEERLKDLGYME